MKLYDSTTRLAAEFSAAKDAVLSALSSTEESVLSAVSSVGETLSESIEDVRNATYLTAAVAALAVALAGASAYFARKER